LGLTGRDKQHDIPKDRRLAFMSALDSWMLSSEPLGLKLSRITEGLLYAVGAEASRIWLYQPGDLCIQGCPHYETSLYQSCRTRGRCFHLAAASGEGAGNDDSIIRLPPEAPLLGEFFWNDDDKILLNPGWQDHPFQRIMSLKGSDNSSFWGYRLKGDSGEGLGVLWVSLKGHVAAEDDSYLESLAEATGKVVDNVLVTPTMKEALDLSERSNLLMRDREIRIRQLKEEVNSFAGELGRDLIYRDYSREVLPESEGESGGIPAALEIRKNALSLAEDAEMARRAALEVNGQLSTIKQAVNSSSDGVALSSLEGEFFYVNQTFTRLSGLTVADLVQMDQSRIFGDPLTFQEAVRTALEGRIWQGEKVILSRQGVPVDSFMKVSTFKDEENRPRGLVWNILDISRQKEQERRIQEYTRTIEKDLVEKAELLLKARYLQWKFIQTTLPVLDNFNVHALFLPCESLGGDFFSVVKGLNENKLVIVLGDCTGHGLQASMDASILLSLVNQNLHHLYDSNRTDNFLAQISREYLQIADEDQFPTMLVALVDLNSREMFYSNANGELPFLIRNGSAVNLEGAAGMHVGFFDDPSYERKIFQFEPGDRLLFYSDALAEIRDSHGRLLGRKGIRRVFEENISQGTENFFRIVDRVEELNDGLPLDDDTTLVQVDFLPPVNREYEFCHMAEWKSIQNELVSQILRLDYPRETAEQMRIALDEMCINAFVHGNRRDQRKYVLIRVEMNCRCLEFTITDQGEGFDLSCVEDPVECLDEILERDVEEEYTHGRGIWITEKLVDFMEYRHGGNCVFLKKNKIPGETLFAKKKFRDLHSRK